MCLDSAVRIPQFYISRSPHRHLSKISSYLTSVLYSSISHLISALAATPLNLSCLFLPRFFPSFDPRHLALLGFGGWVKGNWEWISVRIPWVTAGPFRMSFRCYLWSRLQRTMKEVIGIQISNVFSFIPGPGGHPFVVILHLDPLLWNYAVGFSVQIHTHQNFLMYRNKGGNGQYMGLPFCTARPGIWAAVLNYQQVCPKKSIWWYVVTFSWSVHTWMRMIQNRFSMKAA